MDSSQTDSLHMQRAIAIAWRGQGSVEPNPMVGCVLVHNDTVIGEGWHEEFGQAHAEVNAITNAQANGASLAQSTAYVTLEPCSHQGKTGPCADALIKAKVARVVIAVLDPNPQVAGAGVKRLQDAGIEVTTGVEAEEARNSLAPYLKQTTRGLPWIIAKWAMTVDGKLATLHGDSQWISNEHSRAIVQEIRSRVDGIMVGAKTAINDDPSLVARLPAQTKNARTPTRIVVDTNARLRLNSKLVTTALEVPVIVVAGPENDYQNAKKIGEAGVEVWVGEQSDPCERLLAFLKEFASRGGTNLLVEGGGTLLGSLHKLKLIDEVHVFIGPKLLGGRNSITPVEGEDPILMAEADGLSLRSVRRLEDDVYLQYRRRGETE